MEVVPTYPLKVLVNKYHRQCTVSGDVLKTQLLLNYVGYKSESVPINK